MTFQPSNYILFFCHHLSSNLLSRLLSLQHSCMSAFTTKCWHPPTSNPIIWSAPTNPASLSPAELPHHHYCQYATPLSNIERIMGLSHCLANYFPLVQLLPKPIFSFCPLNSFIFHHFFLIRTTLSLKCITHWHYQFILSNTSHPCHSITTSKMRSIQPTSGPHGLDLDCFSHTKDYNTQKFPP